MKKKPDHLILEASEIEGLKERLSATSLSSADKKILLTILDVYVWLYTSLQEAKISLSRLKSFFGFSKKTEKGSDLERTKDDNQDGSTHSALLKAAQEAAFGSEADVEDKKSQKKSKQKGHGRLGHEAYTGAEQVMCHHAILKRGDSCPEGCGGKLYLVKPSAFIALTGNALASATCYRLEKLRCGLCGKTYTASPGAGVQKYDATLKAHLAIAKNYLGQPFYRTAQFQKMVGVPLPASTQFELNESLANDIHVIFKLLLFLGAQGRCIAYDDTWARILSVMKENKQNPDKDRKGMYTTGILSFFENQQIALYVTGRQHAGENMNDFLLRRASSLSPPICMSDALNCNILSDEFKAIVTLCLNHGRRKFHEIHDHFQEPCNIVLDTIALIYHYDGITKTEKMKPSERLTYHQTHSAPLMDSLKKWINDQLDNKKAEPNSSLGKALKYMQNHWDGLTKFLHIEGCLLDNNCCEQILKKIILCRKNSLFYKTEHGAYIGCLLTSIIHTCVLAKENPVHYLVSLQENKKDMLNNPYLWLPWNYRQQLESLRPLVKAA